MFIAILALLTNAELCINSFYNGIVLWAKAVLPALMPFAVVSRLIVGNNLIYSKQLSKFTSKLYNCSQVSGQVFIISMICGYPIGAKLTGELYKDKAIDSTQATKLATFTQACSPIFVIGTIGIKLIGNLQAALIILVCHYLATILNGVFYRRFYISNYKGISNPSSNVTLSETMSQAINTSLLVGGYIALFSIVIALLGTLPVMQSINNSAVSGVIYSILEVTNGITYIFNTCEVNISIVLICGLVSFGGLCIIMQSWVFYEKCNVRFSRIILIKTTQAALATIISFIAVFILHIY